MYQYGNAKFDALMAYIQNVYCVTGKQLTMYVHKIKSCICWLSHNLVTYKNHRICGLSHNNVLTAVPYCMSLSLIHTLMSARESYILKLFLAPWTHSSHS